MQTPAELAAFEMGPPARRGGTKCRRRDLRKPGRSSTALWKRHRKQGMMRPDPRSSPRKGGKIMTRFRTWLLGVATAVAAGTSLAAPAGAQTWPTQRVTIVVPFGAGSVTDILARILADDMSRRWGHQVIVENRPGLAGTAGVAKSPADGHTLMVTSNGHTVAALVTKDPPFDPVKDFSGITRLASAPLYLIVNPGLPAKTVKEVVELAKAQPGKLNFSSPGLASTTFIAGALFRKTAGINIVHVPFRSAPDAVTAVMRNDVQMYFAPVNLAKEQSEGGKVRAIAAATANRIPDLPNVPTFTESGLPFVYDSWFGLLTPHGVPRPIIEKISKDWKSALNTPEMKTKLAAQFVIPVSDTPDQFDNTIRDETAKLTVIFKEAGITH
jgi:tripartite-type tricarboxylate transporter receptor subunit TctC